MPEEQDEPLDVKSEMDKTMFVVRSLLELPIGDIIASTAHDPISMPMVARQRRAQLLNQLLVAQRKLQNISWLTEAIERAHAASSQ